MRKIIKSLIILCGVASANVALAMDPLPLPLKSLLIVNASDHIMAVTYSQCEGSGDTKMCKLAPKLFLPPKTTGTHYLGLGIGKDTSSVEITTADAMDVTGMPFAKLDHACIVNINEKNGAVILNDYSTPRVTCQYGE